MQGTQITLTGLVASTPRKIDEIVIFRLAEMRDEERANWYTIRTSGQTAENVHQSIDKGDRVILIGRLEVVDWDNGDTTGTSVEVHAEAIGHNLVHNTTTATKTYPRKADN